MTGKSKRGGLRNPPGGRPRTVQKKRQQLIIDASDEEYRAITDNLTTRERTETLLEALSSWVGDLSPNVDITTASEGAKGQ